DRIWLAPSVFGAAGAEIAPYHTCSYGGRDVRRKLSERSSSMSRMNEPGQGGTGDLRESAQQVKENLRDLGSQVRETATQQYEQHRDQAADYYEQGRQRAREMEQGLEQYVQEKPIQSLLIAAGIGMLLGILWKRS